MNTTSCFFTADYRDGQVYYAGKKYPAGHFTVTLMNQYYKNDTAARIAVFSGFGFRILGQLRDGFLNVRELHKVGENLHWAVKALPRLTPFDQIDQDVMQAEVSDLFTEESGQAVCEYFRYRGTIANVEEDEVIVGTVDRLINRDYMQRMEKRINRIKELLQFFDRLSDDLYRTHRFLSEFVDRMDEAERLDEVHLLPLALEIFGTPEMPFSTQYVSTPKNSRSKGGSITRRLSFDRFASFIVTDFFEGLHYGHYLRQCPICGQYFLMQSARRQIYCSTGYAPEKYRGKRLPCRKYAAAIGRKELAEADPITDLYNRRCAAIRAEQSRGVITPEFAKMAKKLARDRKFQAIKDEEYANAGYESDMSRDKLYADVSERYKL